MEQEPFFQRYRQLQHYVRWSQEDEARIATIARIITPHFPALIDDFYAVIRRAPRRLSVITGGRSRSHASRRRSAPGSISSSAASTTKTYVEHRSLVGRRHVAIGLDQVYTNAAISRLRSGMTAIICDHWNGTPQDLIGAISTLNKLLDLDLAIIEDAYEGEHVRRLKMAERTRMKNALHQEKEFSEGLLEQAQAIVLVLDMQAASFVTTPTWKN